MELQDISSKVVASDPLVVIATVPSVTTFPSPASLTDECAVSMATSHDRMDTQSNITHVEVESVVSSWLDDDDCFFQMAMQDIKVSTIPQQRPPAGKGWKVANSKNGRSSHAPTNQNTPSTNSASTQSNGQNQSSRNRGKANNSGNTNQAAAAPLSGGRFDALAGEGRRRW